MTMRVNGRSIGQEILAKLIAFGMTAKTEFQPKWPLIIQKKPFSAETSYFWPKFVTAFITVLAEMVHIGQNKPVIQDPPRGF